MYKRLLILTCLLLAGTPIAQAEEVYMEPESFVAKHFAEYNEAKSLWVTGELRSEAEKILQHRPYALRQKYWQNGSRTIWILEEIGKEEPITAGFVVENNRLVDTQVLIFRESRGWEIRYPAFTQQFINATVNETQQLDRTIDGISGATLSVNAMRKLARLALAYDRHIHPEATAEARHPQPGAAGL